MASVHLRLFGGIEIVDTTGTIIDLRVKKAIALLAYLSVQTETDFSRKSLAALIWPAATSKQARHSLRQALADLRKHIPCFDQIFRVEHNQIHKIPDSLSVDVNYFSSFARTPSSSSLGQAYDLYTGPFLDGFRIRSEPFTSWQEETSQILHERYIQVLENMAEHNLLEGNTEKAIALNNELIQLDPIRESAHRCLMSLYANAGQYDAVDAQYEHCQDVLRQKLDANPEERTIEYYQRLRKQYVKEDRITDSDNPNQSTDHLMAPAHNGREKELLGITSLLKNFRKNRLGHCVLVTGKTGTGKSWLLEQCSDIATQLDFSTAFCRFFDISFHHENGIRDLLIDIIKPGPATDFSDLPGIIADHFFRGDSKYDIYLAVLYSIFNMPLPKQCETIYSMLAPGNREQLHSRVIVDILIHAATHNNQILIFDDVQLAVPRAISVIQSLLQKITSSDNTDTGPFVFIASEHAGLFDNNTADNEQLTQIEMTALPQTTVKQLFPLETDHTTSDLVFLNWAVKLGRNSNSEYTDSLESVLRIIYSKLDNKNQQALQAASILGMKFSLNALTTIIDDHHYKPVGLIDCGFLVQNHDVLEFCHVLVQQCIYNQISSQKRKTLHSKAASYYIFGNTHLHACHLEASGSDAAGNAYIAAAMAARDEFRLDFASYFFDKAFGCASTNQDRYSAAIQKGEMLLELERVSGAIQAFEKAQRLTQDPQQQALAWLGMAIGLIQRHQFLAAKGLLDRCEPILVHNNINKHNEPASPVPSGPDHPTLCRFYFHRAVTALHTTIHDDALRFVRISLEHARQCQSGYWLTRAALLNGKIDLENLRLDDARSKLELALKTAKENNIGYLETQTLLLLARVKLLQADFSACISDLEYLMERAKSVDAHAMMLEILSLLCCTEYYKGQFNRLLQHAELAQEIVGHLDSPVQLNHINNYRVLALYHLGRHEEASRLVAEHPALYGKSSQPVEKNWNLSPIMAMISCQPEDAALHLDETINHIDMLNGPDKLECCFIAIESAIKHKLWEQAETLADTIIMALHNKLLPFFVMCAERVRILSHIDQGEPAASTRVELVDILAMAKQYGLAIHLPEYAEALEYLRYRCEPL